MRQFVLLAAAVFLFGIGTQAQDQQDASPLYSSPFGKTIEPSASTAPVTFSATFQSPLNSSFSPYSSSLTSSASAPAPTSADSSEATPPAPPPQVFGVRPTYDMQGYLGYTFVRFYELPGQTHSTNGFNYSMIYYPDLLKGVIGADGEFVLTLGNQYPYQARFLLGMGGVRARWAPFNRNIEIWAHGLFGGSHFTPQTAYGPQGAFAYEIGGGVDLNTRRERYAFRIGADMVATHFFSTYQFNPKISTGFVYKF